MPRKTTTRGIAVSEIGARQRRRYSRAVYRPMDRRFPKRDPAIEAMYPAHLLPASPQMLVELLRRSLELERSLIGRATTAERWQQAA